jgi:hypothetical protein
MLTIEEIQQRYHTPVSQRDADPAAPHAYCVGWAVCMAFQPAFPSWDTDLEDDHFPGEYQMARMLADINPDLDDADPDADLEDSKAWEFAAAITDSNDTERDFEAAWHVAAQALAYRKPSSAEER